MIIYLGVCPDSQVQDDIGLSGLIHRLRHHTWVSRTFVNSQTFQ